eukprot:scaffold5452_cov127-Isochrysis_galbana.AAC.2
MPLVPAAALPRLPWSKWEVSVRVSSSSSLSTATSDLPDAGGTRCICRNGHVLIHCHRLGGCAWAAIGRAASRAHDGLIARGRVALGHAPRLSQVPCPLLSLLAKRAHRCVQRRQECRRDACRLADAVEHLIWHGGQPTQLLHGAHLTVLVDDDRHSADHHHLLPVGWVDHQDGRASVGHAEEPERHTDGQVVEDERDWVGLLAVERLDGGLVARAGNGDGRQPEAHERTESGGTDRVGHVTAIVQDGHVGANGPNTLAGDRAQRFNIDRLALADAALEQPHQLDGLL